MNRFINRYFLNLLIVCALLPAQSCSNLILNIELLDEYHFADNRIIAVYLLPSENNRLDNTYLRVFSFHMESLGYKVIDINKILKLHSDSLTVNSHRSIADSLMNKKYIPYSDIIVILKTEWDSIFFATRILSQKIKSNVIVSNYSGTKVLKLLSKSAFYNKTMRTLILSFNTEDTVRIYVDKKNDDLLYNEEDWMLIARQLGRTLKKIPPYNYDQSVSTEFKFPVNIWVDRTYRDYFSEEWRDRVIRRMLFANDILKSRLGIELIIKDIFEWDSEFKSSLDNSLKKLESKYYLNPKTINIGFTLNSALKSNWSDKSTLGLANGLGTELVITAQPTFIDLGIWNSLEESLTIAHEVAHLFGAIHISDELSLMYPFSGSFTSEFDTLNKKIIENTRCDFLELNKAKRVNSYIKNLINLYNSKHFEFPIIQTIAMAAFSTSISGYGFNPDYKKIESHLSKIIVDTLITEAVMGFVNYKMGRYKHSKIQLLKVIENEPNFSEAHWYLGVVLDKIGEKEEAEIHKNLARSKLKSWVLEDFKLSN